jgi:hypothetical protein
MAKKKLPTAKAEAYVPKPDNVLYLHRQGKPNRLTPIPYTWKPNYHYILPLINEHKN